MLVRYRRYVNSALGRLRSFLDPGKKPVSSREPSGGNFGETEIGDCDLSADDLSDAALYHMLECEFCLDPVVSSCPVYSKFQVKIGSKGNALRPAVFAI
jgi:hypothetical protein